MVKFSVIVPVYNAAQYIRRCVESVLNQTFRDFELLLIDDGSTDSSAEICDLYAETNTSVKVFHQQNAGPGASRNRGIDIASGEFIVFVDADDYVSPTYLEDFLSVAEVNLHDCQLIQGFHIFNDAAVLQDGASYEYCKVSAGSCSSYFETNMLFKRWEIWGRVFSAKVIRENKLYFDTKLRLYEDGLFWHKYILHMKSLIFLPERGYFYYRQQGHDSLSSATEKQSAAMNLFLADEYRKLAPELMSHFNMSAEAETAVTDLYLNRYLNLLRTPGLTDEEISQLKKLRPRKFGKLKFPRDHFFILTNFVNFSTLYWLFSHLYKK